MGRMILVITFQRGHSHGDCSEVHLSFLLFFLPSQPLIFNEHITTEGFRLEEIDKSTIHSRPSRRALSCRGLP